MLLRPKPFMINPRLVFAISALVLCQCFLAINAWAQTPVHAGTLFGNYAGQSPFKEFVGAPSLETMAEVPDELRALALAHLLSHPDTNSMIMDYRVYDREKIWKKYYLGQDPAFQAQVQSLAFDLAIDGSDTETALNILNDSARTDSLLAQQYICNAIATIGTEFNNDLEYTFKASELKRDAQKLKALLPIIARVPGSANKVCAIKSGSQYLAVRVSDLVKSARPDVQKEYEQLMTAVDVAAQTLSRAYSNCSELQIRRMMSEAIVMSNQLKPGQSQYFGRLTEGCAIDAHIIRHQNGHELAPSNGIAGYMKKTIFFKTLDEIVQILKPRSVIR